MLADSELIQLDWFDLNEVGSLFKSPNGEQTWVVTDGGEKRGFLMYFLINPAIV